MCGCVGKGLGREEEQDHMVFSVTGCYSCLIFTIYGSGLHSLQL